MAGEINFGMLDTSLPARIATSFSEGQSMRRKNALEELAYTQAMQQMGDDRSYREAYRQSAGDMNALQRLLGEKGLYKQANELTKQQLEQESKRLSMKKDQAEIDSKTYKLGQDQTQDAILFLRRVESLPAEQRQAGWEQAVSQYKQLYPQANLGQIPQQYNQQVTTALLSELIGQKSPEKLLPNIQTRNTGGTTDTLAIDPITGNVRVTNQVRNTQSPDSMASVAVQMRGQNMTDARAKESNQIAAGNKTNTAVIELRKEFNALPEVKNYKEVLPIIESVKNAPDTPAGDIDLIYGVGKIMDPNSVVREGEMNLVIKSGSPAQRLMGMVNYVQGGGRLTQGQRAELMQVMQSRVGGLEQNYTRARSTYENAADKQGLPKDQVFIESPKQAERKATNQAGGSIAKVASDSDYNALPPGTVFVGPDGKQRRKP